MKSAKILVAVIALASTVLLAGCDTAEERAEGHYQSAIELLETGDTDRALVELRNVFDLNGTHKEARLLYASLLRERGEIRESYAQFLLSAEQYPDEISSRLPLAEMAIGSGNWPEAKRHGKRAEELEPGNPEVIAISALLDYRDAVEAEDEAAREAAVLRVQAVTDQLEDPALGRRVVIDNYIRARNLGKALDELTLAIEETPGDQQLNRMRLGVLEELGLDDELREQLQVMVERFPDEQIYRDALIQWYTSRGDNQSAEDFLRAQATAPDAELSDKVTLAMFLRQTKGTDDTRAQLKQFISEGGETAVFESLLATLEFEAGNRDQAIAAMEDLIGRSPASEQTATFKVTLAKMLAGVGNQVAARQRVEEVLADDPTQVDALKLRSNWLIEDDKADEAIITLRTALDQAPQDAEVMSLMARAHLRNGSRGLAGELLSLASEASGNAPSYALQYARFLLDEGNTATAAGVLVDSLRSAPDRVDVLSQLGRIHVLTEDWARAQQVEATLRRIGSGVAVQAADALEVARLRRQQRGDEAIAMLERIARSDGSNVGAEIAIVRSYFSSRDFDKAEDYINAALEQDPDRRVMRYLRAAVFAATEREAEAETIYRELASENPRDETVWRALVQLKRGTGDRAGARAVLEEALAAVPTSPDLRWAMASALEAEGDIDGAIAIYEGLYEEDSSRVIVANNLASLLSAYKGEEQAERAYVIARRLRGSEVPAFRDTYGWIALLRGFVDEAIENLEPAAEQLSDDPLVQYHLAVAYDRAGRKQEALEQYRKAVEIAGPADTRSQFDDAESAIERIEAELKE